MKTKKKINPLVLGTAVLTSAGVISRLVGFLYRIFLSRAIGASALGLYQLVFPILTLCYAVASEGIQTAISKFVAEGAAKDSGKTGCGSTAVRYLTAGLLLSILLSVVCEGVLYFSSDWIAIHLLGDSRCGALLRILSYTMLPASIHACINGYYFGLKKTTVPAITQLAEQFARVGSVYVMYMAALEKGIALTAAHAAWGVFFSELVGLFVSVTAMAWGSGENCSATGPRHASGVRRAIRPHGTTASHPADSKRTLAAAVLAVGSMALPLTLNHSLMHLISSFENLLIPQRLQMYGHSADDALAAYGVLSGMVISVIFFPGVLTNSISVLLLPSVSDAAARGDKKKTDRIITLAIRYGLLFGFAFTALFLLFGDYIGTVLFDNALAGTLIQRLSWICPMMYVYSLLCSVLHGLGRAKSVLWINLLASLIRIGMILFLVPRYGLSALLWGMLISQLFSAVSAIILVHDRE
jgi:stage V sporulation protein B